MINKKEIFIKSFKPLKLKASKFLDNIVTFSILYQKYKETEFYQGGNTYLASNGILLSSMNCPSVYRLKENITLYVRGEFKSKFKENPLECTLNEYIRILEAVEEYNKDRMKDLTLVDIKSFKSDAYYITEQQIKCKECKGTGKDAEAFCKVCNGTGEIPCFNFELKSDFEENIDEEVLQALIQSTNELMEKALGIKDHEIEALMIKSASDIAVKASNFKEHQITVYIKTNLEKKKLTAVDIDLIDYEFLEQNNELTTMSDVDVDVDEDEELVCEEREARTFSQFDEKTPTGYGSKTGLGLM